MTVGCNNNEIKSYYINPDGLAISSAFDYYYITYILLFVKMYIN